MNSKSLITAGLLAVGLISTASADTTIYINGSTAYRKATYHAINTLFTTHGNTLASFVGDNSSTSTGSGTLVNNPGNGAANEVWKGNLVSPALGNVTVVANWGGSVSGTKNDAGSLTWPTFLNPASVAGGTESFIGHIPDMNMADNYQASTTYTAELNPAYVDMTATQVAVVEFTMAVSPNAPADLKNINAYQIASLYANGFINMAQLTGNATETNEYVLATGRDDDSGTRTVFELDTGLGFTAVLSQWGLHSASVDGSPAGTYTPYQFGLSTINGNDGDGYSSGGTVAKVLADATAQGSIPDPSGDTSGNVNVWFIGYVGILDANGTIAPSQWLNYNGVAESDATTEQGAFTYFGFENLDIRPAAHTGAVGTFYDTLGTALQAEAGTGAVSPGTLSINSMDVSRTSDGGIISHN